MRLATRTLLWSLLPFAVILIGSFWGVQSLVLSQVREGFHTSVAASQKLIARLRQQTERRNREVLRAVAENPSLKAGLQLLHDHPRDPAAQQTVEDQLAEISSELGFDFLELSDADGVPLAETTRTDGPSPRLSAGELAHARQGYFAASGVTYQVVSVPVDLGQEVLGSLAVGEQFDLSALPVAAVLIRNGKVLASNLPGLAPGSIETGLAHCKEAAECDDVRIGGESYISLPLDSGPSSEEPSSAEAGGYLLRSLQSVDAAVRPIQSALRTFFLAVGLASLGGAGFVSAVSSISIVRPITHVIEHLRACASTGRLPEFNGAPARIHEIRALTESFNHASASIRDGQNRLAQANVEFVGSLANALDARDPYTAGHSRRVSEYACAIARALHLTPAEMDEVQVGALLHDIGKIGIDDAILRKPASLTPEENALIQEHPTIGRRILEVVHGFQAYLAVVELHHENWDGAGYPWGLAGDQTPIAARVVKVADTYDAMTSDRPYRQGMSHADALRMLHQISGTQIDPQVLAAFDSLPEEALKALASIKQAWPPAATHPSSQQPARRQPVSEALSRLAEATTHSPSSTAEETPAAGNTTWGNS